MADLAKLVGEVVSVERAAIKFAVHEGHGTLRVGDVSYAELEPYKGADGSTTTLSNTIFSTVPGAPVFVGKASTYRSKHAALGHDLEHDRSQRLAEHFRLRRLSRRRTPSQRPCGPTGTRAGWCRS